MAYIRYFLLGFGGIALFVGAFVIFNTLSITVAQRTREFATLRTLGASRKQVLRSVKLEGLVIGLVASVIGLFLGFGDRQGHARAVQRDGRRPAEGRHGVRAAHGDRLAAAGHRHHAARDDRPRAARDARAADRGGARGLHAARVALRRAFAQRRASAWCAASLAAIVAGVFGGRRRRRRRRCCSGSACIGLFVGIALLAPRLVKPLAHVVGWPARRAGGVAGELAGANAARNPVADGLDRRRADDRADARHGRGGARRRHEQVDEVGGHRPAPRRLRRRRQRRACRSAAAEGDELAQRARRHGRLARPQRQGARAGRGDRRDRHRPGHDRALLHVRVGRGLRRDARAARRRTARS